jgi:hypothetical protein
MKAVVLGLGCLAAGCELWGGEMPDRQCSAVHVDPSAELILTDPNLRNDDRARNAGLGAFSFAGRLGAVERRLGSLDDSALWSVIAEPRGETSELPFRLIAIVNRVDLGPQLAPESQAGEARLVYTLTDGSGDDPSSAPLPLTVIFEYSLRGDDASSWAARFHALTAYRLADAPRLDALAALVEDFGTELSQIRLNDARSGTAVVHELAMVGAKLERRGLKNTPRREFAGTPELARYLADNGSAVLSGRHRVPEAWLADSAEVAAFDWGATETPDDVAHEFERGTCSGCHSNQGGGRGGFHLAQDDTGQVVLSPLLLDEEVERRQRVHQQLLCDRQ